MVVNYCPGNCAGCERLISGKGATLYTSLRSDLATIRTRYLATAKIFGSLGNSVPVVSIILRIGPCGSSAQGLLPAVPTHISTPTKLLHGLNFRLHQHSM